MNLDKTKVMFNEHVTPKTIYVKGVALEVVQDYIYFRQTLQLHRDNFEGEIARRVQLSWEAFGKLCHIFGHPCHNASRPRCLISAS